jgi:glycosyltransferase involved in cell wall biosynthesis
VISFNIKGSYVNGYVGDVNEYESYLLNSNFDIITNFAAQQWATDISLPLIKQLNGKKIFVPTGFSMLNDKLYAKYYKLMPFWLSNYNANIFTSKNYQDYIFSVNNGLTNNYIIPNGASKQEFDNEQIFDVKNFLKIENESKLILHVGSYTGVKGHIQALKIFLKSKINKNIHLVFIGSNLNELIANDLFLFLYWWKYYKLKYFFNTKKLHLFFQYLQFGLKQNKKHRIHFLKLSREQTIDVYKASSLFLFPSMIECSPIVIYESLASKTPFLSTPVGNVEEIVSKSKSGIILPSKKHKNGYTYANINKSSTVMSKILNNELHLKSMSNLGFDFWKKNYTWEKIAEKYDNLYCQVLNKTL